jgi:transmembrane sensor
LFYLTEHEMVDFTNSPDYYRYKDIVEHSSRFVKPHFNEQKGLQDLKQRLSAPDQTPVRKLHFSDYYKIAAVLVVAFASGIFLWLNQPEIITTGASEVAVLELPDQSMVKLNAGSRVKYRPSKWENQRKIQLEGEAFFEVEKGKKFTVESNQGEVAVLGTKFNIKDRKDYFEVHCYEGAVKVTIANREVILKEGKAIKVIGGDLQGVQTFDKAVPGWIISETDFNAVPLHQVISELERQFDVSIETRNVDKDQLFTGSFHHKKMDIALKAVTIPLKLNYIIESDKKVIIYEE